MSINFLLNLGKRIASPKMARFADEIVDSTVDYAVTAPAHLEGWKPELGTSIHQWLKDEVGSLNLRSTWDRLKQEVHSPDMVLGGEDAGRIIMDEGTMGQLDKNKWLHPILRDFNKARGGIKPGSDSSRKVFEALEEPSTIGSLSDEELRLHNFLKSKYDYSAQQYIRHVAGSDESYNKVVRLAQKGADIDPAMVVGLSDQEAKAYDFAKRKISNYAPHFFDREQLIDMFKKSVAELQIKRSATSTPSKAEALGEKIDDYILSLQKLEGGNPLAWDILPKEFVFKNELVRKGKEGYQKDAIKSFNNYIFSIARKMYEEPAIKKMATAFDGLPFYLRPYARWFIRDFAGYNKKNVWDDIAGQVSSFEYLRTLGWNLRSPIVNLTQQVNTILDAGPKWSKVGYAKMFTKEGKDLFEKSGLGLEIPQAMTEDLGQNADRIDKVKRVLGFFFNKAEEYNRRHAFLSYYSKNEHLGPEAAYKAAVDGVHKSQFQYGKMGMPKVLRTAPGRVGLQFSSFTIKQAEFLWKVAKEDPKKALMWLGGTAGMNYTMQEILGLDMSNVLGFGINFGEALQMVRDLSRGDLDTAFAHGKLSFAQGTGILPSGPGPAVGSLLKIGSALSKGEKVPETMWKELKPIAWQRVDDLLQSVAKKALAKEPGKLPVFKGAEILGEALPGVFGEPTKELMMEQNWWKVLQEQFIRSTERTKKQAKWYEEELFDRRDASRKQELARLIVAGNQEKASRLIKKWMVVPSTDQIYEEILRKNVPREFRPRYIQKELRQKQREVTK